MNRYHIVKDIYPKVKPEDFPDLFTQHMSAMTEHGLERKSDIAAQLAWRDAKLAEMRDLEDRVAYLESIVSTLEAKVYA